MFPVDLLWAADFGEERKEGKKQLFLEAAQCTEGERKKMFFFPLEGGKNLEAENIQLLVWWANSYGDPFQELQGG